MQSDPNWNVLIDGDRIPGFRAYGDALDFGHLYVDTAVVKIRSDAELEDAAIAA